MVTRKKNICGSLIAVESMDADYIYHLDTYQIYHILLIGNGFLKLKVDNEVIICCAPSVFVLKENTCVEFMEANMLSVQILRFDVSFLCPSVSYEMINSGKYADFANNWGLFPLEVFYKTKLPIHRLLPLSTSEFLQAKQLSDGFTIELEDPQNPRWSCRARSYLGLLLELIHQVYSDSISMNSSLLRYDIRDRHIWITKILKEIHSRYAEKLCIQSLAQLVKINRNTIEKEFKMITGLSINEYIITYRLRCACFLLATNELKITEIALKCGYKDTAYFCTQFKERLSMTPMEYRKNIVNGRKALLSV